MTERIGRRFFCTKRDGTTGLQHRGIDFIETRQALSTRGCRQFADCNQLAPAVLRVNLSGCNQHVRRTLDKLFELFVAIHESHDNIIHGQERGRADHSAGDGVVIADDGVLYGIR